MAQRFQQESPPKKRNMPFVQRRGDGFTEFEAMGMVQLVRTRWREGWDVVAQLHNQQHPGHNRSGDSLKKKFSRLYRAAVPPRGAKNHSVILLAHQVHREMIDGVTITPEEAAAEHEQAEAFQAEERAASIATESEQSWVDVPETTAVTEPAASTAPAVSSPATQSTATTQMAVPITVAPRSRFVRRSEWQNQVTRINTEAAGAVAALPATPASTEELLTSVLKVILQSQHQRDLDREEERVRREEEREQRKKELELWRQEMERRRAEDREERLESRRRHEQLMQMMTMLAGKTSTATQPDSE